jgi:hypothetical protein
MILILLVTFIGGFWFGVLTAALLGADAEWRVYRAGLAFAHKDLGDTRRPALRAFARSRTS